MPNGSRWARSIKGFDVVKQRATVCLAIATGGMLVATGCGRPTYPTANLAGEVTIDGQPVPKGGLTFTPLRGGAGTGAYAAVESGRYHAERVPKGPVRVFVLAGRQTGKTVEASGMAVPEVVNLVPAHYAAGIDIEVVDDNANLRFDLSSRAPERR